MSNLRKVSKDKFIRNFIPKASLFHVADCFRPFLCSRREPFAGVDFDDARIPSALLVGNRFFARDGLYRAAHRACRECPFDHVPEAVQRGLGHFVIGECPSE